MEFQEGTLNGFPRSNFNAMSLTGGEEESVPSDSYRRTQSTVSSFTLLDVPLYAPKKQEPTTWEQTGMHLDFFAEKMNLLVEDN